MKQVLRKVLAVLVVLSIVLSVGIIAISGSAAESILFQDDFNGATPHSDWWISGSTSKLENGAFTLNKSNAMFVTTGTNWADYTVQVDVTAVGTNSSTYFAGLAVRESNTSGISSATSGFSSKGSSYEFMLYKTTSGAMSVRLYERGGNGSLNSENIKALVSELGLASANLNDTYTLKVVAKGTSIKCYVNDVLAFDVTDDTFTAGTVALKTTALATKFDNFTVTTTVPDAVSSAVSSATQESSSQVTGSDITNGQILFNDDFSAANLGSVWTTSATGVTQSNGVLSVGSLSYAYLNTEAAKAWANYSVEADVTPVGTNSSDTYFAGITARESDVTAITAGNKGKAYEFMLYKKVSGVLSVRLYERSGSNPTVNSTKKLVADLGLPSDNLNDTYRLKMTVVGNKISCYVNDILAVETTDVTFTAGTIALKSTVLTSIFDNVVVRAVVEEDTSSTPVTSNPTSSTPVTSTPVTSNPTSSGSTSSGSGKYHFEDNFNGGVLHADWAYNYGVLEGGKYVINREGDGGGSNWVDTSAAKALTNYSVDADFTFLTAVGSSAQPTMGIIFRAQACAENSTSGRGYEFALLYNRASGSSACPVPNKMYARLYERSGDGSLAASNTVALADVLGAGNDGINDTYHLRVEVIGNRMQCYVNNTLVFDATDATFASGAFGVRSFTREAAVDNVVVDEITAFTTPDSPEYTYPEGVYYEDDFSTADFSAKGWNTALNQVGDEIRLGGDKNAYLLGKDNLLTLTDYTVEADVRMDNLVQADVDGGMPGIVGRAISTSSGYEFALWYRDGAYRVRLYDRTDKKSLADASFSFEANVYYNLKMVLKGSNIKCYVDDELVLEANDDTNTAGTAGLRNTLSYPAYYDRMVVRASTADEQNGQIIHYQAPTADANGIYFADNNTKADLYTTGWMSDKVIDDNFTILNRSSNLLLNGNYKLLSDYVVEATVMVDPDKPISTGSTNGMVMVIGRGYELSILMNAAGTDASLRLYDRANKKVVAVNTDFTAKKGELYKLTLVLSGNRIRAFADGKLYIDVEDTAHKNGNIGIGAIGYDMRAQNFVLRKVTKSDLTGSAISSTVIPSTGDNSFTVILIASAVLVLCVGALLVLRSRKRVENI